MRGNLQNQLKILAPHPVTETYGLIPLLVALISLDSPFKYPTLFNYPRLFKAVESSGACRFVLVVLARSCACHSYVVPEIFLVEETLIASSMCVFVFLITQ
jgi:hypothetical protein